MDSVKLSISTLLLFASITLSAGQLKCYQCEAKFSHVAEPKTPCIDAFLPETGNPSEVPTVTCAANQKMCYKSISSTYEQTGSFSTIASLIISRGCLNSTEVFEDKCDSAKAAQGSQDVCFCQQPMCNTASICSFSILTTLLFLLAVQFAKH